MGVRLKKDDLVVVTSGKDKGVEGRILDIRKDGRVVVAGANIVKRHQSAQKLAEANQETEYHADSKNDRPAHIEIDRHRDLKIERLFSVSIYKRAGVTFDQPND